MILLTRIEGEQKPSEPVWLPPSSPSAARQASGGEKGGKSLSSTQTNDRELICRKQRRFQQLVESPT
jgi:hypothetical protein